MKVLHTLYIRLRIFCSSMEGGLYPLLIYLVALARPRQLHSLYRNNTEIVIEGFPRCANTFFTSYFDIAQGGRTSIAHHHHASYQIREGVRSGVPCVVLLRQPIAAIASEILRDNRVDIATSLAMYSEFYAAVFKDRERIVFSDFARTISDPSSVIQAVNLKFQTDFNVGDLDVEEVMAEVDRRDLRANSKLDVTSASRPSPEKTVAAAEIKAVISKLYPEKLAACDNLYQRLKQYCDEQYVEA